MRDIALVARVGIYVYMYGLRIAFLTVLISYYGPNRIQSAFVGSTHVHRYCMLLLSIALLLLIVAVIDFYFHSQMRYSTVRIAPSSK